MYFVLLETQNISYCISNNFKSLHGLFFLFDMFLVTPAKGFTESVQIKLPTSSFLKMSGIAVKSMMSSRKRVTLLLNITTSSYSKQFTEKRLQRSFVFEPLKGFAF